MEKTGPESAMGATGWETEGIHRSLTPLPARQAACGTQPPQVLQLYSPLVSSFEVGNIPLFAFTRALMLGGSAAAKAGLGCCSPGSPWGWAWHPLSPELLCRCSSARGHGDSHQHRGPAPPQPVAPTVMAREEGAPASPTKEHPGAEGVKHSTVQGGEAAVMAEPPWTPSHTVCSVCREPGQSQDYAAACFSAQVH